MALLLVAVVMNLLWVAALAAFVVVENGLPRGEFVGRGAGGCSSWLAMSTTTSTPSAGQRSDDAAGSTAFGE